MSENRTLSSGPDATVADLLVLGRVSLSASRRMLWRDEERVKIGSRAFDLLAVLAQRPGEIIDKTELIERAWPNLTVDDIAVRVQIATIRKAVGESSCFTIEAVPGRGYRLVTSAQISFPGIMWAGEVPDMVGRQAILETLLAEVPGSPITTLVGPGGIGKTTVALAACPLLRAEFSDGLCLVDLAAVTEPALVASTIARRLGLAVFSDNPLGGIVAHLRSRSMLLVLDTCEHVIETVAELAEYLCHHAPFVRLLATSREPLRAAGERVHRLAALDLPPCGAAVSLATIHAYPASSLFLRRATGPGTAIKESDAQDISAICHRLDGLPMAIEIAAAQVGRLGVAAIASQLDARAVLLAKRPGHVAARHRTIHSTLNWSYSLLAPHEQRALRVFSIFPGSFTLDAVTKVFGDDLPRGSSAAVIVGDLVSKSLIAHLSRDHGTYRLLDTTREFAREMVFDKEEQRVVAGRHARYCLEELGAGVSAGQGTPAWQELRGPLLEDVRAALQWCFSGQGDPALGVTLTVASIDLWTGFALFSEHRAILDRALECMSSLGLTAGREELALQLALGGVLYHSGGMETDEATQAAFGLALDLARKVGTDLERIKALSGVVAHGISFGDYPANMLLQQELVSTGEAFAHVAWRSIAHNFAYMGDFPRAREALDNAMAYGAAGGSGVSYDHLTVVETVRARLAWLAGERSDALKIAQAAVENAALFVPPISLCLTLATGAIFVATMMGKHDERDRFLKLLDEHATRHSMQRWIEYGIAYRLALVPRAERSASQSARFDAIVAKTNGALLESLAVLGNERTTPALIAKALASHAGWCRAELLRADAEFRLADGSLSLEDAGEIFEEALAMARAQGIKPWELRIASSMMRLRTRQGRGEDGRSLLGGILAQVSDPETCPDLIEARASFANAGERL